MTQPNTTSVVGNNRTSRLVLVEVNRDALAMETQEEKRQRRAAIAVEVLRRELGPMTVSARAKVVKERTGIEVSGEGLRRVMTGDAQPGPTFLDIAEALAGKPLDAVTFEGEARYVEREERTELMTSMFAAAKAAGATPQQLERARRAVPEFRGREPTREEIARAIEIGMGKAAPPAAARTGRVAVELDRVPSPKIEPKKKGTKR